MSPETRSQLKQISLFAEFNDNELDGLLDLVETVRFPAGQCIVKQDETGDCMYILIEGSAKVSHRRGSHVFELAVLKPGDFFGELALVDAGPRSADVETITECAMLKVEHSALRAIAGVYPGAAFKFLVAVGRELVKRMRRGNQKYIDSLLMTARAVK
jgi:CRP-like cAMP-binding protein